MTQAPIEQNTSSETQPAANTKNKSANNESLLVNLLFNIIIPTLILTKLSGEDYLGTKLAIVVALAFPIAYGVRDFTRTGKMNFFSALGVISICLTGGMSLLELDPKYIAIKEAAIPGCFGLATLISLKTRYPLVKTFLYNDKILQVDKVAEALKHHGTEAAFDKALVNASYLIALSFLVSSILNYVLAKVLLVSPPGTEAFNAELGKMTALSFPVIAVPATLVMMGALFYLFKQIQKLTHLTLEDILIHQ
jgi:hypothetical protein